MVDLWMTAFALRSAIPIVAEAGVADLLLERPRSVSALASASGVDADALGRLLRLLASLGIFAQNGDGEYVNTPLSETLAASAPISMRNIALFGLLPGYIGAEQALPAAVREPGATAWDLAHGMPVFEYLTAHPDEAALFQGAMTMFSGAEAGAVTAAYDFSKIETLVDVGGSQGALLAAIVRANPSLRGVLFDLPVMVEGAAELFAAQGVADRATVVGGDFFESVPAGDAHVLKHILHDWDDEHCVAILRSARNATVQGGTLLVIEEALPPGNAPSPGKILDLFMLVVGGRERTQVEYGALFEQAGYELTRIIPTAMPLHVIEATAR
jgi:predicted O-methyltransferase YrrM